MVGAKTENPPNRFAENAAHRLLKLVPDSEQSDIFLGFFNNILVHIAGPFLLYSQPYFLCIIDYINCYKVVGRDGQKREGGGGGRDKGLVYHVFPQSYIY